MVCRMLPVYSMYPSRHLPPTESLRRTANSSTECRHPSVRATHAIWKWSLTFAIAALLATPHFAQTAKPARAAEPPAPSLAREVRHQIQVLPFYSVFDHITFVLEGSKVTLSGQVLRPNLKTQAESDVKDLDGVTVVVNQIEVLPSSPSDDELRRAIYRAIYEDATLARYATFAVPPIHIVVKNGSVELAGVVDSVADKNLAAARAKSVPTLAGTKNSLIVRPTANAAE